MSSTIPEEMLADIRAGESGVALILADWFSDHGEEWKAGRIRRRYRKFLADEKRIRAEPIYDVSMTPDQRYLARVDRGLRLTRCSVFFAELIEIVLFAEDTP